MPEEFSIPQKIKLFLFPNIKNPKMTGICTIAAQKPFFPTNLPFHQPVRARTLEAFSIQRTIKLSLCLTIRPRRVNGTFSKISGPLPFLANLQRTTFSTNSDRFWLCLDQKKIILADKKTLAIM
jgi:hypothetical protein